jgi:hypothetical protein
MSLEFKSYRVGSSDLTGYAIGPLRPIDRRGKSSFRQFLQSNQKEKKSRQSLQIFGHVVAKFMQISLQCMSVDNLWS